MDPFYSGRQNFKMNIFKKLELAFFRTGQKYLYLMKDSLRQTFGQQKGGQRMKLLNSLNGWFSIIDVVMMTGSGSNWICRGIGP